MKQIITVLVRDVNQRMCYCVVQEKSAEDTLEWAMRDAQRRGLKGLLNWQIDNVH